MAVVKVWTFLSFALLVAADGFITDYLLASGQFAEANPAMYLAMQFMPFGMWGFKLLGIGLVLVLWRVMTPTVLCVCCCGMAACLANNCFWL
jgi:hypothetical protein